MDYPQASTEIRYTQHCKDCALPLVFVEPPEGYRISCARCGGLVMVRHKDADARILAFGISALLCLYFSLLPDFVALEARGQSRSITLADTVRELFRLGEDTLALVMALVIIGLPVLLIGTQLALVLAVRADLDRRFTLPLLRLAGFLQFWNMAEIFFFGILVSMIKIAAMANVGIGPAFWFYAAFNLCMVLTVLHAHSRYSSLKLKFTDVESHTHRHKGNIQAAWSLWLTAFLLYLPANLLTMMTTTQLGHPRETTLAGGIVLLWEHGSWLVAGIIFIASLFVPLAKFIAMGALLSDGLWRPPHSAAWRMRLYRLTEFVGRWSMVDVFVVGFLAALIQMGALLSITPGPAALAFAGMVTCTMLAAHCIDPISFWQGQTARHANS